MVFSCSLLHGGDRVVGNVIWLLFHSEAILFVLRSATLHLLRVLSLLLAFQLRFKFCRDGKFFVDYLSR